MTTRIEQRVERTLNGTTSVTNIIDGSESDQRVSVRQVADGDRLFKGIYLDELPLYDVELFREKKLIARVGPRNSETDALYMRIAQLESNPGLRNPGPHLG